MRRIRVLRYEGSFNFSAINNFGAAHAEGDYLLLLNNDTEMIHGDLSAAAARTVSETGGRNHRRAALLWR